MLSTHQNRIIFAILMALLIIGLLALIFAKSRSKTVISAALIPQPKPLPIT